jgi:CspA family cold shock protein
MGTGTLKKWDADRGFGFIKDDAGGPDMFIHINALKLAGIDHDGIAIGTRLSFSSEATRDGRARASDVRLLSQGAPGQARG